LRFDLFTTVLEFGTAEQPVPKGRSEGVYKHPAAGKRVGDISGLWACDRMPASGNIVGYSQKRELVFFYSTVGS
jgi:hypothetical protein